MRPVPCWSAASGPPIMKVISSMAHGSQMTLKVMMKKETFLPLLSCEYVYARPRVRAGNVSLDYWGNSGAPYPA